MFLQICYGRTIGSNCTTNLQSIRCGGICPALGDCHSCLIHGPPPGDRSSRSPLPSVSTKLGLYKCSWCVQNARCHHKDGKTSRLFPWRLLYKPVSFANHARLTPTHTYFQITTESVAKTLHLKTQAGGELLARK